MEKHFIKFLNCYVKHINTKKYNDCIITDHFWVMTVLLKNPGDMRVNCEMIFQAQHLTIKKCLFLYVNIAVTDII